MKIQQLLDSIYLIEVVLEHLEKPTVLTNRIIEEYQIDIREAREVKQLLVYHYNIVVSMYQNAPVFYPTLRTGLKQYFDKHLIEGFARITENIHPTTILDLGSGEGHVGNWMASRFTDATVITLDKAADPFNHRSNHLQVDFESNLTWWVDYQHKFDLVILSEVLHCKKQDMQMYLIDVCKKILQSKGYLLIVEPVDYFMARRISKIKKDSTFQVLDAHHIKDLMPNAFNLKNRIQIQKHKFYLYEKL